MASHELGDDGWVLLLGGHDGGVRDGPDRPGRCLISGSD